MTKDSDVRTDYTVRRHLTGLSAQCPCSWYALSAQCVTVHGLRPCTQCTVHARFSDIQCSWTVRCASCVLWLCGYAHDMHGSPATTASPCTSCLLRTVHYQCHQYKNRGWALASGSMYDDQGFVPRCMRVNIGYTRRMRVHRYSKMKTGSWVAGSAPARFSTKHPLPLVLVLFVVVV